MISKLGLYRILLTVSILLLIHSIIYDVFFWIHKPRSEPQPNITMESSHPLIMERHCNNPAVTYFVDDGIITRIECLEILNDGWVLLDHSKHWDHITGGED